MSEAEMRLAGRAPTHRHPSCPERSSPDDSHKAPESPHLVSSWDCSEIPICRALGPASRDEGGQCERRVGWGWKGECCLQAENSLICKWRRNAMMAHKGWQGRRERW